MIDRDKFIYFQNYGQHKGFYNDENFDDVLNHIYYEDFFEYPDDEEFPYTSASQLLRGSCNLFVLGLQNILGYTTYIIEGDNKKGFHAFSQVYKNRTWYYIDARGETTSFDEFMDVAKTFVNDEYTIRLASEDDVLEWESDCEYNKEAYEFADALISQYAECYTI